MHPCHWGESKGLLNQSVGGLSGAEGMWKCGNVVQSQETQENMGKFRGLNEVSPLRKFSNEEYEEQWVLQGRNPEEVLRFSRSSGPAVQAKRMVSAHGAQWSWSQGTQRCYASYGPITNDAQMKCGTEWNRGGDVPRKHSGPFSLRSLACLKENSSSSQSP